MEGVTNMKNATRHVEDLRGLRFEIPAYQRGYKWRKRDVRYLIEDFKRYDSEKPYYLQPLVVVAVEGGAYRVVDGQQRLTTMLLILKALPDLFPQVADLPVYAMEFKKRPESTSYLSDGKVEGRETPDIRHFREAEAAIRETCFTDIERDNFLHTLFYKATFLWYELDDPEQGPAMFERLNGKRIALTDTELCKALLLSGARSTGRAERAMAWQQMEYALQDDAFYAFIAEDYEHRSSDSRMGLLLNLAYREKPCEGTDEYDEYPLYSALSALPKNGNGVWSKLTRVFHRLEQWYSDPLYYNLIGFLITVGSMDKNRTDKTLRKIYARSGEGDFGNWLISEIRTYADRGTAIEELVYKDSKTKPILLLFNILLDLQIRDCDRPRTIGDRYSFLHRFPFDRYRDDRYDKEHIHATNSKSLVSAIEWQQWMCNVLTYADKNRLDSMKESEEYEQMVKVSGIRVDDMPGESPADKRERLTKAILAAPLDRAEFQRIVERVNAVLEDGDAESDDEQNSIGNLALLNLGINRDQAYAAAPFSVKRAIIMQRIREGHFIPNGTVQLFLKAFTKYPSEEYHWRKTPYPNGEPSDSAQFISALRKTINRLQHVGIATE